jgi:hypothetical protein
MCCFNRASADIGGGRHGIITEEGGGAQWR